VSTTPPLNLLDLAKAAPGDAKSALERDLWVRALQGPLTLEPAATWLLLLEGELIVDLPHGDFRILKVGDSVRLGAERAVLRPLRDAVVLFTEAAVGPP
jgi:hypothetical protein